MGIALKQIKGDNGTKHQHAIGKQLLTKLLFFPDCLKSNLSLCFYIFDVQLPDVKFFHTAACFLVTVHSVHSNALRRIRTRNNNFLPPLANSY